MLHCFEIVNLRVQQIVTLRTPDNPAILRSINDGTDDVTYVLFENQVIVDGTRECSLLATKACKIWFPNFEL
jgi:hypothetical protein